MSGVPSARFPVALPEKRILLDHQLTVTPEIRYTRNKTRALLTAALSASIRNYLSAAETVQLLAKEWVTQHLAANAGDKTDHHAEPLDSPVGDFPVQPFTLLNKQPGCSHNGGPGCRLLVGKKQRQSPSVLRASLK